MNQDAAPLTLVDYLNRLEPAPEPPLVSLWPQTGGWIWLGLAILVLAVWAFARWRRTRRGTLYRRQALQAIAAAGDDSAAAAAILRRAALAAFPRRQVASLHGKAWLAFLDHTYGGKGFTQGVGSAIVRGPYAPTPPAPGLAALVGQWIRRHRRPDRQARS